MSSHPFRWMTLEGSCPAVGWQLNFVCSYPLKSNIAMKALVGLQDALRRSKLFNASLLQPDDFVADFLNDIHVVRRKSKDIGLIDNFTQPSLCLFKILHVE